MKPYGSYVAARTLYDGAVKTMRGMDRLTGMPVLVYSLPARIEPPHLLSRRLVPYSDQGWEQGVFFLVSELPLHAVPAGDPWLAAHGALEALAELHANGQLHGGLTPAQLWSVDGDVRLAGAGLPWGELSSGFESPEGGKSPQADLYALGCTLEALGGVPDPLRGLLSPDPRARPSAREALDRLQSDPSESVQAPPEEAVVVLPTAAVGTEDRPAVREAETPAGAVPDGLVGEVLDLLGEPTPVQAVTPLEQAEPVVIDVHLPEPASPAATTVRPAPAQVAAVPDIRIGFEDVEGAPAAESPVAHQGPAPLPAVAELSEHNPRRSPIRIGWEEDNSWRVVRAPEPEPGQPARPARLPSLLGWVLGAVLVLALAGGLLWWRLAAVQPGVVASCCSVVFRVAGGTTRVNITVLSSPGGSGLAKGDLIGAVPGTLQFPDTRGTYTLKAEAEGFSPMQFTVTVPTRAPVEIDLRK